MSDEIEEISKELKRLTEIRSELVDMVDRAYVRGREYGEKNPKPQIDTSVIPVDVAYQNEQDAYRRGYEKALDDIHTKVAQRFWDTKDGSKAEDFGYETLIEINALKFVE